MAPPVVSGLAGIGNALLRGDDSTIWKILQVGNSREHGLCCRSTRPGTLAAPLQAARRA